MKGDKNMPELTKQQVITRWIVCGIIGAILAIILCIIPFFTQGDYPAEYYVVAAISPIIFAWVCFANSLCFMEWLKKMFTFKWISALVLYFKALGWTVKITIDTFAK